jgi:hypothetical protein
VPEEGVAGATIAVLGTQQPYRLVFIGEKSSLGEILRPIAETVGELLLPAGEMTSTLTYDMVARAAASRRRTIVFYLHDFDPAGHSMPISVARKGQAFRDLEFPRLKLDSNVAAIQIE